MKKWEEEETTEKLSFRYTIESNKIGNKKEERNKERREEKKKKQRNYHSD